MIYICIFVYVYLQQAEDNLFVYFYGSTTLLLSAKSFQLYEIKGLQNKCIIVFNFLVLFILKYISVPNLTPCTELLKG